ncbi:MAG: hypothetical protein JXA30_06925 [Deltaproteobacteria bacterium]|nr:hypothetical protein [Deltaproteobacteria bacterium]
MISKLNNTGAEPFLKKTGFVNLFIGIALAAAMVLGCDTGSEGDVDDDDDDTEEDASKETGSGGSEESGSGGSEESDSGGSADTDAGGGTEKDAGVDAATEPEPPEYTTALVITTDYSEGNYSTVAMDDYRATININDMGIHSDAVCHFDLVTETPFIILRLGSDAINVLNPDTFEIVEEYSVVPGSNPYDIEVVSSERAYISRYELNELLIVEPLTGEEVGTVDLSEFADDDGIPEVSGLAMKDGKLYALVARLDRDNSWTPVGDSYLIVIDAETGEVEADLELAGANPYGQPEYSEALGKFVIAEAGEFSDLENAGIELFDPADQTLSGLIVTEEELGGNVTKALVLSKTKGYALIGVQGDNGSNTHVVTFNPETGKKTGTVIETEGWTYSDIVLTPDLTELWVADRTSENPGIRVFDTETDEEITDEPIDVGLPPSGICFVL